MYVYGLFKTNDNPTFKDLFYVGITKNVGERKIKHLYCNRNSIKSRCIRKYGLNLRLLAIVATKEEAYEREIFLIRYFGRINLKTGQLANMTDGGEGSNNLSQKTRAKIANKLFKIKKEKHLELIEEFKNLDSSTEMTFVEFCRYKDINTKFFRNLLNEYGIDTSRGFSSFTKNRYTQLIIDYEKSNLTKKDFCRYNNITSSKFKTALLKERPDLVGRPININYTKEEKLCYIEKFKESKMYKREFCIKNNLNSNLFFRWLKKYEPTLINNKRITNLEEKEILKLLQKYTDSKTPTKQFCLENNINVKAFYKWIEKYKCDKNLIMKYYSDDYKENIYSEYIKSGLTNKEFCEKHNVSPSLLTDIKSKMGISKRRTRRSDEEKYKIYTEFKNSGLSQSNFCKLINMNTTVFSQSIIKKFR